MNQIERFRDDLARRFPDLAMEIDPPANESGVWFLNIRRAGGALPIFIEWRPDRGFGVSTPDVDDFGTGPDEVYPNARGAFDRTVQLVLSGGRSEPPLAVRLAELRHVRGLSQGELAERAGVGQANISRIENRDDLKISTLNTVIGAMGGSLKLLVHFPDGSERELTFDPQPGGRAAASDDCDPSRPTALEG